MTTVNVTLNLTDSTVVDLTSNFTNGIYNVFIRDSDNPNSGYIGYFFICKNDSNGYIMPNCYCQSATNEILMLQYSLGNVNLAFNYFPIQDDPDVDQVRNYNITITTLL